MNITYDPDAALVYIKLSDQTSTQTTQPYRPFAEPTADHDIYIDRDENNKIVGFEVAASNFSTEFLEMLRAEKNE